MWNAALSKAIWSVLCVSQCAPMSVCVCVFVCPSVCLSTLPFHFHTLRSFSIDEETFRAGTIRPPLAPPPKPPDQSSPSVWFHRHFQILDSRNGTGRHLFAQCQKMPPPLVWEQLFPCQRAVSLSHRSRSSAPRLLVCVRGAFCPVVTHALTPSRRPLPLALACAGEDAGLTSCACFGQRALLVGVASEEGKHARVTECSNVELLRRTCKQPGKEKTQILAPGLKCVRRTIKEILNLMNMH